ncbi:MAG: serine protease, partial [Candidatus Brocadiae bacterium]|nr:serine protease [Candidatus Brocadiia bacterium]
MRLRRLRGAAFLAIAFGVAGALHAQTEGGEFARALRRASESIVRVSATFPLEKAPFRLDGADATTSNTGFFVGPEGQVLTSLLGLAGCTDITVVCTDGREAPAQVAAVDQPSGLALLKADLSGTAPLEFVKEPPAVGTWILLASARRQDGGTAAVLAPGLVSSRRASVRLQGVNWQGLMVTSVNVRRGSAAAPLLDPGGRLAGVVLGVASAGGAGDCLALPSEDLAPILEQLREGRSRRLGWLGVS